MLVLSVYSTANIDHTQDNVINVCITLFALY